jgi:phosphoribosylformylglycinamidine synthase
MAFFLLILLLSFLISAIDGFKVKHLRPSDSKEASSFKLVVSKSHLIFTAETHNFPTGVAPFR